MQSTQLVLRQRFSRKEIDGAASRVCQERLGNRNVVTEGLPTGAGRGHHDVFSGSYSVDRFRLVRVERKQPLSLQAC
ncbi:hypothetical protein ES707_17516 [subsurface metagenome]